MTDIVTAEMRSMMMAGIRGKNTKPEIIIRKELHKAGFRFRIHDEKLPGKPDLILPKYKAVIFVNGCFWHGHNCHLFKWPSTNKDFWHEKISRTKERDREKLGALFESGWRVMIVWECALKGRERLLITQIFESIAAWLRSEIPEAEIRGTPQESKP